MADVPVIGPGGVTKYVDEDEAAAEGLPQGHRLATPEERQQMALKKEYGGIGHQVAALGTGIAKGATVGLSDYGIAEYVPGGREALQAYESIHGTERGVGEVAGGVGAAFVPGFGQAGLVGKGMAVASAPARALYGAGRAVEGAVASTRLGRLGGMVAGATLEGMGMGAGQAISESAIYDTELTGERLAASIGTGALLSGGAAFGLGAAGKLLGKGGQAISSAAQRAISKADGSPGALARLVGGMSETVSGQASGKVTKYLGDAHLRRIALDPAAEVAKHTDDLLNHASKYHEILERHRSAYSGAAKASEVARTITRGNEKVVREAAQGFVDDVAVKLDAVVGDKAAMFQKGMGKLMKEFNQLQRSVASAKSNADIFVKLDSFKRSLGKAAYSRIGAGSASMAEQATYRVLDDLYEKGVRPMLENQALFGGAAATQKAVNAAWAPFIKTANETGVGRLLSRSVPAEKGATARVFNREGLAKALKGISGPEKTMLLEGLARHLDDAQVFSAAATKHRAHLSAGDATLATQLGSHADGLKSSLGRLREAEMVATDMAQMRQLNAQGEVMSGGLGYLVGGGLGAVGGAALGALRNPAGMITKLAAIEQLAGKVGARMDGASAKLFGMASLPATRAAQAAFGGDRERFEASTKRTRQIAADPGAAEAEIRDGFAGLVNHAPRAIEGAVSTAMRAHEFLRDTMPTVAKGEEPLREDVIAHNDRLRALEDPTSVLEGVADGTLSDDAVEAVRAVYPDLYADMRQEAMFDYAAMLDDGRALPYEQRLLLSRLFDFETDPTTDPAVIALVQGQYAMAPPDDGGATPPGPVDQPGHTPQVSQGFMTESERLMARE